eukprot:TRINITY_DN2569_c0_g1_i3.p2 TRINITY_DN2569_c0_g1~~TRINITY_DN2569_c0_g1_i3.p2  ORF type:complete len:168 (-),score=33.02 TRINITY_DN2569_c0_g1_i3:559-1062(-)
MALQAYVPRNMNSNTAAVNLALWKASDKILGTDYEIDPATGVPSIMNNRQEPSEIVQSRIANGLRDVGIFKAFENFDKQNTAVAEPKKYLEAYTKRRREAMVDAAILTLRQRDQIKQSGASDVEANGVARDLFEAEMVKQNMLIAYEFPSDVVNQVEEVLKKHRAIA